MLKRLEKPGDIALDTETSGLDWRRHAIVGYVVTFSDDPRDSYYVPFRHRGDANVGGQPGLTSAEGWNGELARGEKELVEALGRQTRIVGHNLSFDLKMLHRTGFDLRSTRFEDTIINAPLLDEYQSSYSLETCCSLAGVQAKKSAAIKEYIRSKFPDVSDRDAMGRFWELAGDDPMAIEYATGDGTSTWQLCVWQHRQIAEQGLETVHDVESRLIPVLARMSLRGIRIDEGRLAQVTDEIDRRIEEIQQKFRSAGIFGSDDFNPRSGNHVKMWCSYFGRCDWPFTPGRVDKKTGKRIPQPSFPEAWLETHEPGMDVVNIRKFTTLRDSFVRPMRDHHLYRGRVHAEYHQLRSDEYGTVTGRLSCSSPNLQQVPKRNRELGNLFRSIFVPDEGKTWVSADYAQCEPVLLAFYSRCRVLLNGYRATPPIDAHMSVTRAMNPVWRDMPDDNFMAIAKSPEVKAAREIGKRVNQTLLTGGGAKTLGAKYKVPEPEQVMREYFHAMPEIRTLQKKAAQRFRQRGYIMSLLGRRARLRDPDKDYTALNRMLQCGNADIIKLKLVEMDEYLRGEGDPVDLLNNIHDAVDFQFEPEQRRHLDECLRIMTDFSPGQLIELDLPLRVDVGEGASWAEATYKGE